MNIVYVVTTIINFLTSRSRNTGELVARSNVVGNSMSTTTTTSAPTTTTTSYPPQQVEDAWQDWLSKNNDNSFSQSYPVNHEVFVQNYANIMDHNARYNDGLETFLKKIDRTASLTPEQWAAAFLVRTIQDYIPSSNSRNKRQADVDALNTTVSTDLPSSWNITASGPGKLSPIRDQGTCGVCWAFSSLGAIENAYSITNNGQLFELSVQEQLDCNTDASGCAGGWFTAAFDYVQSKGSRWESNYPYNGTSGTCSANRLPMITTVKGYTNLPEDADTIKLHLMNKGACAVGVDSSEWQFYGEGIFSMPNDTKAQLNHGVVLAGWGPGYWLIKNSFGEDFGLDGYIKLSDAGDGGIFLSTVYCPLI